jgi:mono/diheme cytochrome c family protein
MNGRWPFRPGTALGIAIMVIIALGVGVWISREAQSNLPMGFVGAGESVYYEYCSECHGDWGEGTPEGPSLLIPGLTRDAFSNDQMDKVIGKGTGAMPRLELDRQETADVIAYVRDLQDAAGLG